MRYWRDVEAETMEQAQKRVCNGLKSTGMRQEDCGKILFPGDTADGSEGVFGHTGIAVTTTEIEAAEGTIVDGRKQVPVFIYGCADYAFGMPREHHQTFFVYVLERFVKSNKYPD